MRLLAAMLLLLALTLPVGAADTLYSPADFDTDAILDALPESVRDTLPREIFAPDGFAEKFSAAYFLERIGEAVQAAFTPSLGVAARALGCVLIASALTAAKGLFRADSAAALFEFVSGLAILLVVYESAASLVETARLYLTELSGIVTAMVPVLLAVETAGGNLGGAAASSGGMMLALAIVETLAARGLFPVLRMSFGLLAAAGIGGSACPGLAGISRLVRNTFTWLFGIAAAVISAVMSFQHVIAVRADSLSMRAVKFAAAQAIPVAGGIAADAAGAVAGSLSLVRATVGTVGVILIALLTLPVLVQVLLARMGVVIAGTAAEVLGLSREKELLGETAGLLGFLAAVCVIAALMFVYALTLFAKTAAAMGA